MTSAAARAALAGAVHAADPAVLLPALRRGEESRLVLPLTVVDAVALPMAASGTAWSCLVRDSAGTVLGVPLVAVDVSVDVSVDVAVGGVRRAVAGDGAATALLHLLDAGAPAPFDAVRLHAAHAEGERAIDVDQTHDSVVVGAEATGVVVKWSVHVAPVPGAPPAVAAARHLDAVGFTATPTPVGFLVHLDGDDQVLLASVTRFLPGARDGWDWYVDDVRDWLAGRTPRMAAVEPATALGELVAGMHVAFATPWSGCPDPVQRASDADAARWLDRALRTVDEAETVTTGEPGERFRARAAAARAVVTHGLRTAAGTTVQRVHGDLHVGQVLRWDGGYAVSDFDGNPVLPAAERDLPQPPARDVAGMLRAIDHVGRIVDRVTEHGHAADVRAWAADARAAFLAAYRAAVGAAGRADLLDERLLPAMEVEQECRELVYAARHLPRWTYVPDAALVELLPLPGPGTPA